jgi:hypothetical protein
MLYDYFNGCVRARSLDIAAQIRKKGRTIVGIYRFMFWLPSEKYKIMS